MVSMTSAPAAPEHAKELAERLPVALLAAVADRAEQTKDGVEALFVERELPEVGLDEPRPLCVTGAAAPFVLLHGGPVDARHAEAGIGQGNRVASEATGCVEDLGRRLDAGELRRGRRLRRRVALAEVHGVGGQVDLVEKLVEDVSFHQLIFFKMPSARWFQGTRCVTPAVRERSSRWVTYQS